MSPRPPLALVCGWYRETVAARRSELSTCLARNLANPWIHHVHLLVEEPTAPAPPEVPPHPKLHTTLVHRRTSFGDLIRYAAEQLAGSRVIVANADIHFD